MDVGIIKKAYRIFNNAFLTAGDKLPYEECLIAFLISAKVIYKISVMIGIDGDAITQMVDEVSSKVLDIDEIMREISGREK